MLVRRSSGIRQGLGFAAALVVAALAATPAAALPVWSLRIESAPGGNQPLLDAVALSAGDTLRAWIAGYDIFGFYAGAPEVDWAAIPNLATVTPAHATSALLQARLAGRTRVHAIDGNLEAWSGFIDIGPGVATTLVASLDADGAKPPLVALDVSTDSTLVLYAGSTDTYGNWTGNRTVTWWLDSPLGSLQPGQAALTVFDPQHTGSTNLRLAAAGFATVTLPVQVRAGRLNRLAIGLPNGIAVADTVLVVAATLPLRAFGFDADDNPTPPPVVDWAVTGSGIVPTPASGNSTTLQATSPGTARCVATRGSITASTGIVRVVPGGLTRLRVSRTPETWLPFATGTLDADQILELFALGEDALGHALGPVAATWTSTNPNVARPLASVGSTVLIELLQTGQTRFVATRAGAESDSTGTLNVVAGTTMQLRIESRSDGLGSAIGASTLSADSTATLYAVGRDRDGNFTGPRTARWAISDPIGDLSTTLGPGCVLDARHTGHAMITATDFLLQDTAGPIDVVPGAPQRARLEDATGHALTARSLQPGESLQAVAAAQDADGNRTGEQAGTWSWSGDALATLPGAPTSRYDWTASRAGQARLVVQAFGLQPDSSGTIRVGTGDPTRLEIHADTGAPVGDRSLSADSTLALHAMAFDSGGNALGEVPVVWTVELHGGNASVEPRSGSSTLLRPLRPGAITVAALHPSGVGARTGSITIQAGALMRVGLETAADGSGTPLGARSFAAGETLALYAVGRDAAGNPIGPVEVSWVVQGGIGRAIPSFGSSSTFVAEHAGSGTLRLVHPSAAGATSGLLQVVPAAGATLVIERGAGDPFDPLDTASVAADDSLQASAVLRDAFGNWVADVPAMWSLAQDPGASLSTTGPATSTWLRPRQVGAARLRAQWTNLVAETGILDVRPGRLVRVTIETRADGAGTPVGALGLVAGQRFDLFAVGRDQVANFVAPVDVHWIADAAIGRCEPEFGPSTALVTQTAGLGRVRAEHAWLAAATTGTLTIGAGNPSQLRIERTAGDPDDPITGGVLTADDSLQAFAVLRDAYGNWAGSPAATWSLAGDPAAALVATPGPAASTWFLPRHPGSARLHASWNGLEAETGSFALRAGAAFGTIPIRIAPDTLRADGRARAHVDVGPIVDRAGNPVADGTRVELSLDHGTLLSNSDLDLDVSGLQRATQNGRVDANLMAPTLAGTGRLAADCGAAAGLSSILYLPVVDLAAVPGGFTPSSVLHGGRLAARVRVQNRDALGLQVVAATLRIQDGNGTRFEAGLAHAMRLDAGATGELELVPGTLSSDLDRGSYAPSLEVRGIDDIGQSFVVTLELPASSLVVVGGALAQIDQWTPQQLTAGHSVRFEVELWTAGDVPAQLDAAVCVLHDSLSGFSAGLEAGSDLQLEPGTTAALHFTPAVWPAGAPLGATTLTLELRGTQPGGAYVQTLALAPLAVESAASLAALAGSTNPSRAPLGSHPALRLQVRNLGGSDVRLDATTMLQVAGRSAALAAPTTIANDSIAALDFMPFDLDGIAPGRLALHLAARGTQNGAPFLQDLALPDSLLWYAPAALTILGVVPSQTSVTRNQTEPWNLEVLLLNSGQSQYRIDAAGVRIVLGNLDRTDSYTLVRQKPGAGILAPAALDTLTFQVTRTGPDVGLATLEANVRATDLQSGGVLEVDTYLGGKGSVRVQNPAVPVLSPLSASQPTIVAGQTRGVDCRLDIRNDGEAALLLDTDQLATSLTATPPVPVTVEVAAGRTLLGAGESLSLRYRLGPFAIAAGPLQLRAGPRLVEANRGVALAAAASETLLVQTPGLPVVTGGNAPAQVTRAQTRPWTTRFQVENRGQSALRLVSPRLTLRAHGVDVSAASSVQAPTAFDTGSGFELPGGATRALTFTVTATDTVGRDLNLHLDAGALELDSGRSLVVDPGTPLALRVEVEPRIGVLDSTLAPLSASRGQLVSLRIVAQNSGESGLDLDPTRTTVRLDGTTTRALLTAPVRLAPGVPNELRFAALAADVPAGRYAVVLHLEGTENGNAFASEVKSQATLRVDAASSLEVLSMIASQPLVTSGQERPWSVRVAVRNHGAAARLEAATLVFSLGAEDVSAGFAWHNPDRFESGRDLLAAAAVDTLRFDVERSADVEGLIVIDARLQGRDLNSGAPLETQSLAGSRASIRAVTPAQPIVVALQPSQAHVSAGQTGAWNVRLALRNDGGTAWIPDWNRARIAIGAPDDSLDAPDGFDSGNAALEPGETASATLYVRRTGAETGGLPITATLVGTQPTDGRDIDATPCDPVVVVAQRPGRARLESFESLLPRPGFVNTGALLPLGLRIANHGEADLAACWVRLRASAAAPAETLLVTAPAGGASVVLQPRLRAAKGPGAVDLEAEILMARDVNDSTAVRAWEVPDAADLRLVVESPGVLELAVVPSQTRLSGGQTSPWWVALQLTNSGEEPLRLPAPRAVDLEFRRAGIAQPDYVVQAPDSLLEGGLEIPGGTTRTLRYKVVRTGSSGGNVVIAAVVAASHVNDPAASPAVATGAAPIEIDAEPGVRVLSTESITWRRLHGHDDFRVNAGQEFALRVVIENTGGTWLDSIQVEVDSQRGNSRFAANGMLSQLAPGERGQLELQATAGDWLSQPGLPESFAAYVTGARDRNTGLSVLPGEAVDNTAFAYVEAAAAVELSAWIESPEGARDGTLSAGQRFVVAARGDNRGSAAITESGRVALQAPAGFDLEEGAHETFFAAGQIVRWTLRAPQTPLAQPESLTVALTALPQDENDGQPARILRSRQALAIEIRPSTDLEASLAIVGPPGALDGTISAGQSLELEIVVRAGLDLVDREAEILLPAGWLTQPGQSPKIDLPVEPESRATWRVSSAGTGSAALQLRVTARDQNDESVRAGGDTIQVTVVHPARLALGAAIVAPQEALDGRVLPGQTFTLRARVHDRGDAGVVGEPGMAHGALRLANLPAGWSADAAVRDFDLQAGMATADWRITAPLAWRPDVETLRIQFERTPRDANSGLFAALDPDSSLARVGVSLAGDGMVLEVEPAAAKLAVPGQRRVPLLVARIENRAESAVILEALGALQLTDGVPADRSAFTRLYLVRTGAAADTLAVDTSFDPTTWIVFPATASMAHLEAGESVHFTLLADVPSAGPARKLGIGLRATDGAPLLRALESGSRTPVPVRVDSDAALVSPALQVVPETLQAYNAPNPFHVGRETTTIHYQVAGSTEVRLGVYTLQGALVWESQRHESVAGPELRGITWDGRNGVGQAVRNGVYVCEVRVGSQSTRFKIAVVR